MELIPSSRTGDRLSWSERATQIHPRIKSLEKFKQNLNYVSSLDPFQKTTLDRFQSDGFKFLIGNVIEKKLKSFYQWANHNFDQQFVQQSQQLKDLAKTVNSKANPYSFRKMLESFKASSMNHGVSRELTAELIQTSRERRELSDNPHFVSFLDQMELLFGQSSPRTIEEIDQVIQNTENLATRLQKDAEELNREKDEYSAKAREVADVQQCGRWSEEYKIVPYRTWGNATCEIQLLWDLPENDCNHKICKYWREKYNVLLIPHLFYGVLSWGSLDTNLRDSWRYIGCDNFLEIPEFGTHVADYNQCGRWSEEYKIVPFRTWGNAPTEIQNLWNQRGNNCNYKICQYWLRKYDVVPGKSWGNLPTSWGIKGSDLREVWGEIRCDLYLPRLQCP